MLSAPQPLSTTCSFTRNGGAGDRQLSPTPSEQSCRTTATNPASLFSVSQADNTSDSFSIATTTTTGDPLGSSVWDKHSQYNAAMPLGCSLSRAQLLTNPKQNSANEKDLFEFLREAQLEHYYTALTTHLKIRSVQQIKYVEDSDLTELGFSRPEQRRLRKYFKRECPQTTIGKLYKRLSRPIVGRSSSVCRIKDSMAENGNISTRGTLYPSSLDYTPASDDDGCWSSALLSDSVSQNSFTGRDGSGKAVCRIISSYQLEKGTSLGEGEFGRVYQGVWRPDSGGVIQVAIKVMDTREVTENIGSFLNEISVMHRLNHSDIVRLYGVCIEPEAVKIVTELAPLRSLLECLREPELRPSFPVPVLHRFAVQISRGMAYLEENDLVHRDLAARNVLVFSKDMVKISDFGMSRALHLGRSYYQSNLNVNLKLPTAWCAPESIHDLIFTPASDVWAYGVTLWEMFTYGFTPWAGMTGKQILEAIDLPRSARLDQPDACPDAIYDAVMRACWTHEPKCRPSFGQLLAMLPRLCPERWITTREYHPSSTNGLEEPEPTGDVDVDILSHFRTPNSRSLGNQLSVKANESVYVLGKRSSHLWKVVSNQSGQVGCLPTVILKPYATTGPRNTRESSVPPSSSTSGVGSGSSGGGAGGGSFRSILRTNGGKRETVSRLGKFGGCANQTCLNGSCSARGSSVGSACGNRLTADKISLPQGDFRHVGHVGSDGQIFGDLGLLGTAVPSKADEVAGGSVSSKTLELDGSKTVLRQECVSPSGTEPLTLSGPPKTTDLSPGDKSTELEDPFKSPVDSDISSMGLDFGSSLLDEVFKCFSLDASQLNPSAAKLVPVQGGEPDAKSKPVDVPQLPVGISENKQERLPPMAKPVQTILRHSPPIIRKNDPAHQGSPAVVLASIPLETAPVRSPSSNSELNSFAESRESRRSRWSTRRRNGNEDHSAPKERSSKTSRFGSLSRRCASVSRNLGSDRSTDNQSDNLAATKRLTISRPVLLTKPTFASNRFTEVLPIQRSPSVNCSTITSLGEISSVGRGSLAGSATSRDSSLTIVSSTNGYAHSLVSVNGDIRDDSGTDDKGSYRSMYDRDRTRTPELEDNCSVHHSSTVSRAPSVSSMTVVSQLNAPRSSVFTSTATTDRGIRAFRGGDMVFRASNNTTTGTLNQRKKTSGSILTTLTTADVKGPISKIHDSASVGSTSTATRFPDYLTQTRRGSSALLSRLDGLTQQQQTNKENGCSTGKLSRKPVSRRFSTSSSSSSSSSPLSTTSPMFGSPWRTQNGLSANSGRAGAVTSTAYSRSPNRSNGGVPPGLDNNIASFWGSTFAEMLNRRRDSGDADETPIVRTPSSELHATLTNSSFKGSLSVKSNKPVSDSNDVAAHFNDGESDVLLM
ncbi:unnamed protein product [Calicophoron daubneyi]|uniref:non-specific protein-tyrosine kinase n=1 Tax=Calicophoron daubneyi TaxID=300641 RepID=A0AAV2TMZ1_CALDB